MIESLSIASRKFGRRLCVRQTGTTDFSVMTADRVLTATSARISGKRFAHASARRLFPEFHFRLAEVVTDCVRADRQTFSFIYKVFLRKIVKKFVKQICMLVYICSIDMIANSSWHAL